MSINIAININSCDDCKHSSHTGRLTKGGAKPCCNHRDTVNKKGTDCFKRVIPYTNEYYDTWNRTVRVAKGIPNWCPLKNGGKYQ